MYFPTLPRPVLGAVSLIFLGLILSACDKTGTEASPVISDIRLEIDQNLRVAVPLSPIGKTTYQNISFSWVTIESAEAYSLRIRTELGAVIFDQVLFNSAWLVSLSPGKYEWSVVEVKADGPVPDIRSNWTAFEVTASPLDRENILGIEPDLQVISGLIKLNYPEDAVQSENGEIFIADAQSHVIRRITSDEQSAIFAGTLEAGYSGDGNRLTVKLNVPTNLNFDPAGNLIFLDSANYLLRKIDRLTGEVSTLAGIPGVPGLPVEGALAVNSALGWATSMDWDDTGNLYIAMLSPNQQPQAGKIFILSTDGRFYEYLFNSPVPIREIRDIHVESSFLGFLHDFDYRRHSLSDGSFIGSITLPSQFGKGLIYSAEDQQLTIGNHTVIYTLTDDFQLKSLVKGFANVSNISTFDGIKDRYLVTDSDAGSIMLLQGNSSLLWRAPLPNASIGAITHVRSYDEGIVLFLDNLNPRVIAHSIASGEVWIHAGNSLQEYAKENTWRLQTGFWYPAGLTVDSEKNIYIAQNNNILKIDRDEYVTNFAGSLSAGDVDGHRLTARFNGIRALAIDEADRIYVADTYNNKIRRIATDGTVETVAGTGLPGLATAGAQASASGLNHPHGVLPLPGQNGFLIADSWNNTVLHVDDLGVVSIFAGKPFFSGYQGSGNFAGDGGPAVDAVLNTPIGLTRDSDGNTFIADSFNNRIRVIDTAGKIETVWGGQVGYSTDGSKLNMPADVHYQSGYLFIADTGNGLASRIRQ